MFDFIPEKLYIPFHYNVMLVFVLLTLFHTQLLRINDPKSLRFINAIGWVLFGYIVLYLGFRPISGVFVDMTTYAYMFDFVKSGYQLDVGDVLFNSLMELCAQFMDANGFFFICVVIYTIPCLVLSKRHFKKYWFYSFLILAGSFSFFNYGTNTIRNGMASSMFLLGLALYDKKVIMYSLMFLAVLFHKSMAVPFLAFIMTQVYNNPRVYLGCWFLAIPLSLALGGFWESLFASMGFDERTSYLTTEQDPSKFSKTGFRWDFLVFSGLGVFSGWYFIIKKEFEDVFFTRVYCTYLTVNAFWILVIRANFSDRFSYLSWFMMGFVIIYPLLKKRFFDKQNMIIGLVVTGFFMFTYLMNFVLVSLK